MELFACFTMGAIFGVAAVVIMAIGGGGGKDGK